MPFTIDKDRQKMFEVKPLDIPDSLKSVVSDAPADELAIEHYLARLVKVGKITADTAELCKIDIALKTRYHS